MYILLKTTLILIIASAAICAAGPSSEIDEPAGALTLRQALALTLTRNPEFVADGYDIRIAEARILQGKAAPESGTRPRVTRCCRQRRVLECPAV